MTLLSFILVREVHNCNLYFYRYFVVVVVVPVLDRAWLSNEDQDHKKHKVNFSYYQNGHDVAHGSDV